MEWVPHPDEVVDENNIPRRLTDEEKTFITKHIPYAAAADQHSSELSHESIVQWCLEILDDALMDPTAIAELIDFIVVQHKRSLVVPGTPIGITAAEAVGATTTQMTLNSVAPHEEILFQDLDGSPHLVKIGPWIDSLIENNKSKVQLIPENRTQYLPLKEAVYIATCDNIGKVTWEKVTAVTKHLPVGDLVLIKTKSGRSATVTQSKSLLIWDGKELVQRNGSDANIGDLVPIIADLCDPPTIIKSLDLTKLLTEEEQGILKDNLPFTREFGLLIGLYLVTGSCIKDEFLLIHPVKDAHFKQLRTWCYQNNLSFVDDKERFEIHYNEINNLMSKWIGEGYQKKLPVETLFAPKDFIVGIIDGIRCDNADSLFNVKLLPKQVKDAVNFIRSRLKYNYGPTKNDVFLDPIVFIEYVSATEYVYDLTVPVTTNFSLMNGLGISDTFHKSGSSKSASYGIDAMRDLILARKTPKNEACTIYFEDKQLTFEEVLNTRRFIVGSVVADFIKSYDINTLDKLGKPWWYDYSLHLYKKEIPKNTKVLRLYLNVDEMYKHHVTIAKLAESLEKEPNPSVITLYGAIADGIIDVYPDTKVISTAIKKLLGMDKGASLQVTQDLLELMYLDNIVMVELPNIRVKGISGIKQLYPLVSPVLRAVAHERKLNERDKLAQSAKYKHFLGTAWVIFYNHDMMKMTGIIDENLSALYDAAGITIIAGDVDKLYIDMPSAIKPSEYINKKIANDQENIVKIGEFLDEIRHSYIKLIDIEYPQDFPEDIRKKILEEVIVVPSTRLMLSKIPASITSERKATKADIVKFAKIDKNLDTAWIISYTHPIDKEVEEFYNSVGLTILGQVSKSETSGTIVVNLPLMSKPSELVNSKLTQEKKEYQALLHKLNEARDNYINSLPTGDLDVDNIKKKLLKKTPRLEPTALMQAAEFVIAETDGSNLKELLAMPGVDKTRTTCNNMYTIASTLGIEAARSFLIRALTSAISNNNSYVHPANIMMIAEFITSRGEPYGATYTGISRQAGGHLSLATLERAGKVFIQNALHGRDENIKNVSASVAVGARIAIGSGSFDIAQDIVENGVTKTLINDDVFNAHKRDESRGKVEYEETDYSDEFKSIQTINDDNYDLTAGDKDANLFMIFSDKERAPVKTAAKPTDIKVIKQMKNNVVTETVNMPADALNALDLLKTGIPKDEPIIEEEEKEEFATVPVPIISTGIITNETIAPIPLDEPGIPVGLANLLTKYLVEIEEQPEEEIDYGNLTKLRKLPEFPIPAVEEDDELPDITGISLRDTSAITKEERDVVPMDITKVEKNL